MSLTFTGSLLLGVTRILFGRPFLALSFFPAFPITGILPTTLSPSIFSRLELFNADVGRILFVRSMDWEPELDSGIKFFFSGIDADFGLREEEDEELSEELFREECSLFFSDAL